MNSDSETLKQLISDLHSFDKEVRRSTVIKLGMVGSDKALIALISTLGNCNEDMITRGKAAMMLGKIRSSRAVPVLIDALYANGYQTPIFAAEALGKIGDTRAILALQNAISQSKSDKFIETAKKALRKLGHDEFEKEKV